MACRSRYALGTNSVRPRYPRVSMWVEWRQARRRLALRSPSANESAVAAPITARRSRSGKRLVSDARCLRYWTMPAGVTVRASPHSGRSRDSKSRRYSRKSAVRACRAPVAVWPGGVWVRGALVAVHHVVSFARIAHQVRQPAAFNQNARTPAALLCKDLRPCATTPAGTATESSGSPSLVSPPERRRGVTSPPGTKNGGNTWKSSHF